MVVSYKIQITHNLLRLIVSEKNFAFKSLDANTAVAPHIGLPIADAAYSIAAVQFPRLNYIIANIAGMNGAQPETERANMPETGIQAR